MLEILGQCAHVQIPDVSEETLRYYRSGTILWAVQQLWSLFLPCFFLMTGWSAKLAAFAEKRRRFWYGSLALYLLLFIALYQLLSLPLSMYSGYFRPQSYGLSLQSLPEWFVYYGKGVLLLAISALAFVWIFYVFLRKSPKRWWLYGTFAGMAIGFFMMVVQPIWIDPLFNDFGPMKDKELEQQILSLASQAGIHEGRIYEVNKSRETNMLNAYVVGFGHTKRIVLWDTLIQNMTTPQILFVVGHEMGHYVLHHMWWSFCYFSFLMLFIFYIAYRWAPSLASRFQSRFGFVQLSNIASFPLFLFLFTFLSLATDPLSLFVSRTMERQADRFGLDMTHDNQAAGEAFVILQQKNLANPRPDRFTIFWRSSHPSLQERVDFTNSYCPYEDSYNLKSSPK